MRLARALIAMCLAAVGAGCGLEDPTRDEPQRQRPSVMPPIDDAAPVGDTLPPAARAPERIPAARADVSSTPRVVVRAFAARYMNWTHKTLAAQQRRLAALAAPGFARELRAAADLAEQNLALERDRAGSRGRVVAVTLRGSGGQRRAICVTREEQLEHGRGTLEGPRYRVTLVAMRRLGARWRVSRWEPQP